MTTNGRRRPACENGTTAYQAIALGHQVSATHALLHRCLIPAMHLCGERRMVAHAAAYTAARLLRRPVVVVGFSEHEFFLCDDIACCGRRDGVLVVGGRR